MLFRSVFSLVGQGEIEIANVADITLVVLSPESGDEVQFMKAGLLEIADVYVINKSDRPGGNQLKTLEPEKSAKTYGV